MRHVNTNHRSGFTLVEILIVVIILGILASITIGLFENSTNDAKSNALKDDLRSMRNAIQLYNAQHGTYPTLTTFETQMTQFSKADGTVSDTKDAAHPFGPYILAMPEMPVGTNVGKSTVTSSTYSAGYGWSYDATSGNIKANLPDGDVDSTGMAYNTY